jgi:hypothetical protein
MSPYLAADVDTCNATFTKIDDTCNACIALFTNTGESLLRIFYSSLDL